MQGTVIEMSANDKPKHRRLHDEWGKRRRDSVMKLDLSMDPAQVAQSSSNVCPCAFRVNPHEQ